VPVWSEEMPRDDSRKEEEMSLAAIVEEMEKLSNPHDSEFLQRFFKTGPGQYGEGDLFRGIRVPVVRQTVRKFPDVTVETAGKLLKSKYHEDRLLALLMLVRLFQRGDAAMQKKIYDLYLASTKHINNWDLVDSSAEQIVGGYLFDRSRAPLARLARSPLLWDRRISILATFYFIKRDEFDQTLRIAEMHIGDAHDLMHKAVGWMLREVGNRDPAVERRFLRERYRVMPRTMLRYAIEKFPETERKKYLAGTV
jgi:3-methyladenine DNA glycosylase AlkD